MVLPHFAKLYSMAIKLRPPEPEVKRESTTSCGSLHMKHNIVDKYSCLLKVTWQCSPSYRGPFPLSVPLDIHDFPTGIPQAFAQSESAEILNVSVVSPQELHTVFVRITGNASRNDFRQLFRRK